jgi:hypothetical protein
MGGTMRERIFPVEQEAVSVEALEALLQARIGWVNEAISPFAVAAHQERVNRNHIVPLRRPQNDFRESPSNEKLQLAS